MCSHIIHSQGHVYIKFDKTCKVQHKPIHTNFWTLVYNIATLPQQGLFTSQIFELWLQANMPMPCIQQTTQDRKHGNWNNAQISNCCKHLQNPLKNPYKEGRTFWWHQWTSNFIWCTYTWNKWKINNNNNEDNMTKVVRKMIRNLEFYVWPSIFQSILNWTWKVFTFKEM